MMEKLDFIENLLKRDLTRLCFEIFRHLDSSSLVNCKLVCHSWKDFINYHFYQSPKGKKCLSQKLAQNYLNPNYEPKTLKIKLETNEKLFAVVADKQSVCVTTLNGSVINYKFHTLELLWELKVCDQDLQHCMSEDRVFAVTSITPDFGNHVYIIDRSRGIVTNELANVHIGGILGVQVYQNNILATADNSGTLKFHEIDIKNEEPKLKHEHSGFHGFTHLDQEEDVLVSGSGQGEIIAWDFKTCQKICEVQSHLPIMTLRVKWPLVVACTTDLNHEKNFIGVKLFNFETEALVRHIPCGYATDVDIKGETLFICGSYLSYRHSDLMNNAHQFWSLSQLLDQSLKLDQVQNREIRTKPEIPLDATRICANVGSDFVTTDGYFLVQRSFWP